jgi:hypothetical protein
MPNDTVSGQPASHVMRTHAMGAVIGEILPRSCSVWRPAPLRAPLDALRVWLGKANAIIMAVLLLVIDLDLIGKGIGSD